MAARKPAAARETRTGPQRLTRPNTGGEILLLAGPTACGKSDVALELALRLRGEIVSVDSMQVYRGMDVGTAKPAAEVRDRVHHHLLDVANPSETFSAARFLELASAAVGDIHSRSRLALLCGGTGLYFKAWTDGLDDTPPSDPVLRGVLEQTPLQRFLQELDAADPAAASRIDRRNPRRVIRAVEVLRLRGIRHRGRKASWGSAPHEKLGRVDGAGEDRVASNVILCLDRDSADLRRRIDARVDAMFAAGLVAETRRLIDLGLQHNATCLQALGYRQVLEHLEGTRSLAETISEVKLKTWRFAKRQRTWFRHQANARWINVPAGETAAETARRVESAWREV